MQQLKIGTTLQNGKYSIKKVLGQGGFGITYMAFHTLLERTVAIKEFFPKDFCNRNETTSRVLIISESKTELVHRLRNKFIKESRNLAKLDNPGIVKIQDIFEENNTAYYVMDYIDGISLDEMVKSNGPLPEKVAIEYIGHISQALDYIHSRHIMHLDVKPANIIVRKCDNRAILIDFGLSKQYDSEGNQTSTTPTGLSHGYAPIEQYKEGGINEFSPQTDVYSLAATMYYILTGSVPPHASDIIDSGLAKLSLNEGMWKCISKAMSAKRASRYNTTSDFIEAIRKLKSHRSFGGKSTAIDSGHVNNYSGDESTILSVQDTSNINRKSALPKAKEPKVKSEPVNIRLIIAIFVIPMLILAALIANKLNDLKANNSTTINHDENVVDQQISEQVKSSTPHIIESPNYYSNDSEAQTIAPTITLISDKRVGPKIDYLQKWMADYEITDNETIYLDTRPWRYDYQECINSIIDELPVPTELDDKYLYYWTADTYYNYFIYCGESYAAPKASRLIVTNFDLSAIVADLSFENYIYAPKIMEANKDFASQEISMVKIQNEILYFSHYATSYAEYTYGLNGYITAYDLRSDKIKWTTNPLVCNSDFQIYGNYIITGYGFTLEPDYMSIVDIRTGQTINKINLADAPAYIRLNGNKIFVHTYSHEYVFGIKSPSHT